MVSRRSTTLTDQEGVHLVGRVVTRNLGWLFRSQDVADQGIDAHVEVAVDGSATGRLVALQIKSGPSYFKQPVQDGWTFYYTARERNLWNGHVLPVMVVLVDLEEEVAYWQRISPETERRTKKRYAVKVPKVQTVSDAADAWELAASGLEQIAHERWEAHLEALPPQAVALLKARTDADAQRELIALHLAEGRLDATGTAQRLFAEQPVWMQSDEGWPWAVLGAFCARHDAMLESSRAYEMAADHGGASAGKRLGVAVLHAVSDAERARLLIHRAREHPEAQVSIAIAEAILEHPVDDARPMVIDRVIEVAGTAGDEDATVQSFLAEQAARARDALSAARHAERALVLVPDHTDVMHRLAKLCLQRSATPQSQPDDVTRAIDLLSDAVTQTRRWSGRTNEALELLAKALIIAGRHDEVLHWLLPAPHGTASAAESHDSGLLRLALTAAYWAESELTTWILGQLGDTDDDLIVKVRLGMVVLPDDELISLWSTELDRAETDGDFEPVVYAVLRLADLGVDRSARLLPLVERGILPGGAERLPAAIARLRHDADDGVARLRSLALTDVSAAHKLVLALMEAGRVEEAVEACELAFERFREPAFQIQRAEIHIRSESPLAAASIVDALPVASNPNDYRKLATKLAAIRADEGDLAGAERLLTDVLSRSRSAPAKAVWNVVRVQLAQAAPSRAAATVARYQPATETAEDAWVWLQTMSAVPWDSILVSKAIALADQFQQEPKLATALLTHVISATRGVGALDEATDDEDEGDSLIHGPVDDRPTVAGELHRRAFEALGRLIEVHGDETGARMFRGDDPDEAVEELIRVVRESAIPDLSDLLRMIARARVPVGMLALPLAKTYTEVLVYRAAGQLVSVPLDDSENDLEVAAARDALGSRVVVDLSSLVVLGALDDTDSMLGRYGQLLTPGEAMDDVQRAVVSVQGLAASPASIGWDPAAGRPWMRERTDAEYRLMRERTAMIESLARLASVRTQRASVFPRTLSAGIERAPWVAAIEVAAHENVALWCDDLAVRRLARSVNVSAFSTMAVVEMLTDDELTDSTPAATVDQLAAMREDVAARMLAEYVVDVPVTTDQIIAQARNDNWMPVAAAALVLSRPGWWQWRADPIAELLHVYSAIREHAPKSLPQWQYAAMLGAARGLSSEIAARVLCAIALLGWEEDVTPEPAFGALLTGCKNAREAAAELDNPADPLLAMPAVLTTLTSQGIERSTETVQNLLSTLGSDADDH